MLTLQNPFINDFSWKLVNKNSPQMALLFLHKNHPILCKNKRNHTKFCSHATFFKFTQICCPFFYFSCSKFFLKFFILHFVILICLYQLGTSAWTKKFTGTNPKNELGHLSWHFFWAPHKKQYWKDIMKKIKCIFIYLLQSMNYLPF